jgi:hypothetical protein
MGRSPAKTGAEYVPTSTPESFLCVAVFGSKSLTVSEESGKQEGHYLQISQQLRRLLLTAPTD